MKKGTKPARRRNKSARYRAKKKLRVRRKKLKTPHAKRGAISRKQFL